MIKMVARLGIRFLIFIAWAGIIVGAMFLPALPSWFTSGRPALYVYAFTDSISPEAVAAFYKQTGVQVRLSYFQSNDELLAKLLLTGGKGYDIVVASDYMIQILREQELLQKIDRTQVSQYQYLDARLLGRYYDRENSYSLPLHWTVYGLGYSKQFFPAGLENISWGLVFEDPQITTHKPFTVTMPDDRKEVVFLASLFLSGTGKNTDFTPQQREQIERLLIKQKKWVESYTSDRPEYELASGIAPLVVSPASYMKKIMEQSDDFGFVLPSEGSLLVIDNLAITKASEETGLAHQFINLVLTEKMATFSTHHYGVNPSNVLVYKNIPAKCRENRAFFPDNATFKKLGLLRPAQQPGELEKLWLAVKTA